MVRGFFIVGNKGITIKTDGDDPAAISQEMTKLSLTRVGNFAFDGEGYLCDGSGNIVYGYGHEDGDPTKDIDTTTLQAIKVYNVDENGDYTSSGGTPLTLNSVSISKTGEIIGTDSDGESITVGMLALANVPNPNALEKSQGPYYSIRENTGYVLPYEPGEGTTGSILSNGLEMSNVDLAKEFSEMITTQRGFQANTRIISVTDEMLEELVNIKR
jgi:flagellar hook protein FlgE